MKSEFVTAITQLAAEKGVPREMVMEAIQQALVSAYKQHEEDSRLITAEIDNDSGDPHVAPLVDKLLEQRRTGPQVIQVHQVVGRDSVGVDERVLLSLGPLDVAARHRLDDYPPGVPREELSQAIRVLRN